MFDMKEQNTSKQPFIGDDFLLQSEAALRLYHDYARDMPIIDYHNHLSAKKIADNKPLKNIAEAWLNGDHYKWRAMRANGVDAACIHSGQSREHNVDQWLRIAKGTAKILYMSPERLMTERMISEKPMVKSAR